MEIVSMPTRPVQTVDLQVRELTPEAWAPFGQIIKPATHGGHFSDDDAQLILDRGTPRYYIMTLPPRKLAFNLITRHLKVTQCLSSVGGKDWLIGVAPPNDPDDPKAEPDPDRIAAFRIPGDVAIMLHRSTWHIGPYTTTSVSFFNLELSDTNQVDHYPVQLNERFGFEYRFSGPLAAGV
jgi:ureidoglycolate hydrolase